MLIQWDPRYNAVLDHAKTRVLDEYGKRGYAFWKRLITDGPLFLPEPTDPGLEVEVSSFWDRSEQAVLIRVMISVLELKPNQSRCNVPTTSFLVSEDEHIEAFLEKADTPGSEP
jgi:hypothetical protein